MRPQAASCSVSFAESFAAPWRRDDDPRQVADRGLAGTLCEAALRHRENLNLAHIVQASDDRVASALRTRYAHQGWIDRVHVFVGQQSSEFQAKDPL